MTYDGLHMAVAGALCNVAIAVINKMQFQAFLDFPGRDSYDTFMHALTGGDFEKIPRDVL